MTEPMRHPELELSAYLDGDLQHPEHEAVESHLRGCADCTALLAELRSVVARARTLEDRALEQDLWPGIARRIGATPAGGRIGSGIRQAPMRLPRFSFSLPQLAAAALAVSLLSGGAVWWTLRAPHSARGGAEEPAAAGDADASTADFEIRRYDQAVAELQQTLKANRSRLDPETVRTVEANLAVIDSAIEQARRALRADPANPYLSGHLAEQMKRKIRVLQRTADAVTAEYGGAS